MPGTLLKKTLVKNLLENIRLEYNSIPYKSQFCESKTDFFMIYFLSCLIQALQHVFFLKDWNIQGFNQAKTTATLLGPFQYKCIFYVLKDNDLGH